MGPSRPGARTEALVAYVVRLWSACTVLSHAPIVRCPTAPRKPLERQAVKRLWTRYRLALHGGLVTILGDLGFWGVAAPCTIRRPRRRRALRSVSRSFHSRSSSRPVRSLASPAW